MELRTLTLDNCTVNAVKTAPDVWTVRYYFRKNKVSSVLTYQANRFPIAEIKDHVSKLNTCYKLAIGSTVDFKLRVV